MGQLCPIRTIVRFVKNADHNTDILGLNLDSVPQEFKIGNYIKPSSARFLEIEYRCGNGAPLQIQVPKSHYIVGNELLSKTYVLRYLEHLPIYIRWKFDESEYSLRIIDDNSVVFSLSGSQHILLEEDDYSIIDSIKLKDHAK
jgi:hypothetical protein